MFEFNYSLAITSTTYCVLSDLQISIASFAIRVLDIK